MNTLADTLVSGFARLTPFGKRTDDPLANIKTATRWLDSLPIGDAFKCQQAILHALRRFNENSAGPSKERLAVLMLLDEKSRDLQDTLVHQYLRNPRMSRPAENQLWHAIYGLYREVADGYHGFVQALQPEEKKKLADSQLPLVVLRAIRIHGLLLKWRAIRYLPAGEKLWLQLHALYRIAETAGFQLQPRRAYPEDPADCSCETAYLHILMLNLANSGTLYPRQLDLLDHWLRNWHGTLRLEARLDAARHNFVVDLSADHGPRRVRKPEPGKPLRFWATAELLLRLEQLQAALRDGRSPAQLDLTENARAAESLELLEHLHRQWSSLASREQRRAPRESIKRLVDVTHGLGALVNQIKTADAPAAVSPYGSGLDARAEEDMQMYGFVTERTRERAQHKQVPHSQASPEVERWVMQDESELGYGAIVEVRDKDWLRVGALIGIKAHDSATWRLGIVRRLSRLNDDTSSVGIETLAETPALAMLYHASTPGYTVNGFDNSGATLPLSSLWLAGSGGRDSVIIDPIHFAPGKVFEVHGAAEPQFISLGNPIERSEGWMRVAVDRVRD